MKRRLIPGAACLVLWVGSVPAQTTVEIVATRDTTLYEDLVGQSNGAGTSMIAGTISRLSPRRAIVAFDDLSAIPAGSAVLEAELRLEMINTSGGSAPVAIHQVVADWGEAGSAPLGGAGQGGRAEAGDATWLHREFDQLFWDTPGGDLDPSPLATIEVASEGPYAWRSAALADLVARWARGDRENHGLILVGDEARGKTTKHFSTREGNAPPRLIVTLGEGGNTFIINQGIAGAWFEPATAGQGFLIDIEPETSFIFLAWFTFEAAAGSKVGSTDQRWLTAQGIYQGGAAVDLPIFNTTGGAFDTVQAVNPPEQVGLLTIRFDDCTAGTVDYRLDEGLADLIEIERVIPGTEVLCEALTGMR